MEMEKKRSRGGSAAIQVTACIWAIIADVSHKVRVGLGYGIFAAIEYKIFFLVTIVGHTHKYSTFFFIQR